MRKKVLVAIVSFVSLVAFVRPSFSATAAEIDRQVDEALAKLYETVPAAKELAEKAKGILVFPKMVKAGFVVGGQYGEGALRINGQTVGYYKSISGSFGLQAGAQSFGFALFFMTDQALEYLEKSSGWEIGVGPSLVIVDKGRARNLTTTTLHGDIYAFIFGQKGLMAGMGLQGTKVTKFNPEK